MRSISLISSSLLPLALAAACAPPAPEDSALHGVQAGVSSGSDLGPELQAEPVYGSFDAAGGGYSAELPSFTARFEGDAVLLDVGAGQVSLRPGGFGRGGAGVEPGAAVAALGGCEGVIRDCHPRLELARGEVLEWWAVKDGGLEQGWTLAAAPEGRGELSLGVQVTGASLQVGAQQIGMQLEGGGQLLVSGLLAWDADGQLLPSRFEAEEGGFRVRVDDRGARYPIEVDPTYTTINFDDRSAPCNFSSASTPATFYSSVGLTLSSAAFEVLNECGNFGVTGHTAPNFLAWNNGGPATGLSETFTFSPPATSVTLNAGSNKGGTGTLVAYDSAGGVITSSSISIGTTLQPISVSSTTLIDHVIFTATGASGVVDDLVWVAETDADSDGYIESEDCDDSDASINPGATEICDAANVDEDCDGLSDDADSSVSSATKGTWYQDADSDGYAGTVTTSTCDMPSGYLTTSTDCDDTKAAINPGATEICDASNTDEDCDGLSDDADSSVSSATKGTWYQDADSDGYAGTATTSTCDMPSGYLTTSTDCDDTKAAINPGATEICDASNTDEDCDGLSDDADSSVSSATKGTWYQDADSDGYAGTTTTSTCDMPTGYLTTSTDCDDTKAAINPGATEVCDASNTDEDCDGLSDDADSSVSSATKGTWYRDADSDGYAGTATTSTCDIPSGYLTTSTDCDDTKAAINPGATEVCDASNTDEDCDGLSDDADSSVSSATKSTWYRDADTDGYAGTTTTSTCDQPTGYLTTSTDCDDTKAAINPGATEVCDASNTDEDCDGLSDDADSSVSSATKGTWYRDADSDGYAGTSTTSTCDIPSGYLTTATDCDDTLAAINPGATEVCDAANTDEDCDGLADDADSSVSSATKSSWYQDSDSDGYGGTTVRSACDLPSGYSATSSDCDDAAAAVNPGATEVCDASDTDEDCDGQADDADSSVSAATYSVFYVDTDADTFGDPATPISLCDETLAAVDDDTDCDDTQATVYPGAPEITGDGIDQDCDEGELCYTDGDGDGWHTDVVVDSLDFDCSDPGEALGSAPGEDCDDTDPAFHPGASETDCSDPTDYNCDGSVAYDDADSDGFAACLECDDGDAGVNPDATEVCDSVDNDCDGTADGPTAIGAVDWFADQDGDTYTDPTRSTLDCTAPEGYAAASAEPDCEDTDEAVNPGAAEGVDDALDQDCDGLELCFLDFDDDGYRPDETSTAESADLSCAGEGVATTEEPTGDCDDHNPDAWPGAPEIGGDEIDQDCDGEDTSNDDDSGDLPEDTAANTEDTADGAAEEGGTSDGKGGCACAVTASRPASSLGAWLLGALIGLRTLGRRRRSA